MPHIASRILIGLLSVASAFGADAVFTGVERVVAVGDVHGDYNAFLAVLRAAGVIDQKSKWIGGKTHLVQTGDVLDRGADSRKVMDLLIDLEKQAPKAGGRVHPLIGNHEAMNLYGDLRYVVPGEYSAFRSGDSANIRTAFWEEEIKSLPSPPGDAARRKWEEEHPLGWFEHRLAFGPKGNYGKWIRSHNVIVKINDAIYLHGGISQRYADTPFQQLNSLIAAELADLSKLKDGSPLTGEDGPLWYRGLAEGGPELVDHVERVLATNGVQRIVIGHTPTAGAIIPRFNGKVIQIDVGLSAYYGSHPACLVREGDKLFAIHRGEKIPLPSGGPELIAYLKKAVALEPAGSLLAKYLAEVERGR
jgi:hypothetical protein